MIRHLSANLCFSCWVHLCASTSKPPPSPRGATHKYNSCFPAAESIPGHAMRYTPHFRWHAGKLGRAILTGVERAVLSRHRHRHTRAVCILGSSWGHKAKCHWSLSSQDLQSPTVPVSSNTKTPAVPKPPWQRGYPAHLSPASEVALSIALPFCTPHSKGDALVMCMQW